jgi:hypothetical protein
MPAPEIKSQFVSPSELREGITRYNPVQWIFRSAINRPHVKKMYLPGTGVACRIASIGRASECQDALGRRGPTTGSKETTVSVIA